MSNVSCVPVMIGGEINKFTLGVINPRPVVPGASMRTGEESYKVSTDRPTL